MFDNYKIFKLLEPLPDLLEDFYADPENQKKFEVWLAERIEGGE